MPLVATVPAILLVDVSFSIIHPAVVPLSVNLGFHEGLVIVVAKLEL